MNEKEYQLYIKKLLEDIYPEVETQWYPFRGYGRKIYYPVVDIAVGPFAIKRRYEEKYTKLIENTSLFIKSLINKHNKNVKDRSEQISYNKILHFNENARCLLCIEVEETGSTKHCLGNLVNASALGRIGILVARSDVMLNVFLRQRVYLKYLADVGKNTFKTDNALVLSENQFNECLETLKTS